MFRSKVKFAALSILLIMSLLAGGCAAAPTSVETTTESVTESAETTSTKVIDASASEPTTAATSETNSASPSASSAVMPTTAATAAAAPTTMPTLAGAMPYTNWTTTALGTIQWNTPVPAPIAYDPSQKISITIPEGSTLVDICKLLEKKGVQTFYHTFTAALNNDFPDYAFLSTAKTASHRRYVLDGYLFPDTYQFYVGEKPYEIFARFLSRTEQVLASYTPPADLTMDQVIIMASLIEEEADASSRANVSSVLHNRLAAGKLLELDKTINYVEWYIKPLIVGETTAEINAFNGYYNTYKASCPGLPAGPITNPGRLAIEAAITPAVTTYMFFVTDANGIYYYATTYEEHQANLISLGLG